MSWQHPGWPFAGNLFSPQVEHYCYLATKPGWVGVEAAVNLLLWVPKLHQGELLSRVWRTPLGNRMAWAILLLAAWRGAARSVRKAAGSDGRLVEWFKVADYDAELLPYFRGYCGHRGELRPRLVVYRGGCLPADELARGLAWTPFVSTAAGYALRWQREARHPGPLLVVRRTARREDVLWRWKVGTDELLIAAAGPWRLHTDNVQRMERLARLAYAREERDEVIAARKAAAFAAAPAEDSWGGWGLEAGAA